MVKFFWKFLNKTDEFDALKMSIKVYQNSDRENELS